jgi:hypothetical protein
MAKSKKSVKEKDVQKVTACSECSTCVGYHSPQHNGICFCGHYAASHI